MTRRRARIKRTPPPRRNPVARALRKLRPKVVPSAAGYSRKRLPRPAPDEG